MVSVGLPSAGAVLVVVRGKGKGQSARYRVTRRYAGFTVCYA